MPKTACDYSRTVIYKIQHDDDEHHLYIGSSTNFTKRKCAHKSDCNNEKSIKYNLKVYKMIRENGGWENFNMVVLKEFPCKNKREADMEEDRIMRDMKSNMNSVRPYISKEEQKETKNMKKKKYYELNSEFLRQKGLEYYEANKETINIKKKEFGVANKERLNAISKAWYEANKDKCMEKVTCDCGSLVTKCYLNEHKKTKKHLKKMND